MLALLLKLCAMYFVWTGGEIGKMADRCYIQKRVLNATKVRTFKPPLYLVCRRMQQSTVRPVVPTAIAVTATRWLEVKGVFCLDSLHLLR